MKSKSKFIKGKTAPEKMTREELAYVAGLLDGCGTFELNQRMEPQIRIEKRSDVTKIVALKIGGSLRYRKPSGKHNYYRFAYSISGEVLKKLLRKLKPFLKSNKRIIGVKLLLQAFDNKDSQTLRQIKKQLSKADLNKKIGDLTKNDGPWFDSLPEYQQ